MVSIARKLDEIQNWRNKSESGDLGAKYNLANAYMNGNGLPKNEHKAARLMVEAADGGYVPAQYALGTYFLNGSGVNSDYSLAYAFFNLTASDLSGFRETAWAMDMITYMENYFSRKDIIQGQYFALEWEVNSQWYK